MQFLFDFFPVLAFFAAYQLTDDIFVATGVIIAATVLQVAIHWIRTRHFKPLHLISAGLVLLFGGLTLLIHDPIFIMWKVTAVNWLFAAAFLASQWAVFGGRPLVQRMMESAGAAVRLAAAEWRRLNLAWVAFFVLLGAANLAAFRLLSEANWVKFKLFGIAGLSLVFVLAQSVWIANRDQSERVTTS